MHREDKNFIQGFWALIKHSDNLKLEQQRIAQKERELQQFAQSKGQDTQIFIKQIDISQKQVAIMEQQTEILNQTKNVYVGIFIATIVMAIATFMMAIK